jgi:hypothetical protein
MLKSVCNQIAQCPVELGGRGRAGLHPSGRDEETKPSSEACIVAR